MWFTTLVSNGRAFDRVEGIHTLEVIEHPDVPARRAGTGVEVDNALARTKALVLTGAVIV